MANFDDFDLDLKEIKSKGTDITPAATGGGICTPIIWSVVQGCTPDCITTKCSDDCVPPSERNHPSCRGPLNDGTVQINC